MILCVISREVPVFGVEKTEDRMKKEYDERLFFHSPNIVNLCMDAYDEKIQQGRLYHQYTSKEGIPFSSVFEAFGRMERLYDDLQFPQTSTKIRSFLVDRRGEERFRMGTAELWEIIPEQRRKELREMESFEDVTEHRGKEATFLVRVKYRQNSSWQGEVTWVDGQKKEYFRSALELVRLMDSVLSGKNN